MNPKIKIEYTKNEIIEALYRCSYSGKGHDCENCPYNLEGIAPVAHERFCLSLLHDHARDLIETLWRDKNGD